MFRVLCECGREIEVSAPKAGGEVTCACGQELRVPRLTVLRSFAAKNSAAPGEIAKPSLGKKLHETQAWPESFFTVCAGNVGPSGSVSPSAMENYVRCVASCLDTFLGELEITGGCEVVVCCALLPGKRMLVEISVYPEEKDSGWTNALEQSLRNVAAPLIHGAPLGFACYRRLMLSAPTLQEFRPFEKLLAKSETDNLEEALMRAAGLEPEVPSGQLMQSIWRRMTTFLVAAKLRKPQAPTPEESYAHQRKWIEDAESWSQTVELADLKRGVIEHPDSLGYRTTLARKFYELEQWDEAVSAYTHAIHTVDDCASLFYRRAHAHQRAGNRPAALRDFNRAIELVPFDPWFFHSRASVYMAIQAWQAATDDLNRAIELAPHDSAFYLFRAQMYHQLDQPEEMAADLERSLELDPNCGPSHVMLGSLLQAHSPPQTQLAIEHFSKAVELMPDDVPSRISRSLAYLSENKFALALDDCDRLLEQDPELATAHGIQGRVLQLEGEYEAAIEACSRAIELGLEDSIVYVARGFSYAATDEPTLADEDYASALRLDPENPLALQLRGKLNLDTGDLDAAMDDFRKASEIAPDWSEPRAHIAFVHRMNDNPQAAVDEQSNLIAREPNHPGHLINRAFAYMQLSEFDLAAADYDRALDLAPEDEQIYFYRGKFRLERQTLEPALADFNRALAIDQDDDSSRYYRAHVYLAMRRYADAAEGFSSLIRKYPEDPRSYLSRAWALGVLGDESSSQADRDCLEELLPELVEIYSFQFRSGRIVRLKNVEQFDEALAESQDLIDATPDNPKSLTMRASVYWDMEAYVEAYEDLTHAMELLDPEDGEYFSSMLSSRGQVQAEMGEYERALKDLDQAVDLNRKEGKTLSLAYALNGRSLVFSELNRPQDAEHDFEESVRLCPTNPWVYYHRGLQLYQQGESAEAIRLLNQALQLRHPRLPSRKKQRAQLALTKLEAN